MTIDEVITKMYASMAFDAGARPDWQAQREVFAPDARLVRLRDGAVYTFDPQSFRHDYEAMIDSGVLTSLFEREVSRELHVHGDLAHALSIYEIRTAPDGDLMSRAVKSIQLFQKDRRWWISAMIWQRTVSSPHPAVSHDV